MQSYVLLLKGAIPWTRLISYDLFKEARNGKIKDYILHLLEHYPDGLDTRQISEISGIYVQSLTHPLKTLKEKGLIIVSENRIHPKTQRYVMVYKLP